MIIQSQIFMQLTKFLLLFSDLKIQNILVTNSRHLRLIDFGLSKMDMFDGDATNSGCGTPFYMAPEVVL